jgi:hypothetical protein
MAQANVTPTYTLVLNAQEFRLVTLALADMLQDDEDFKAAMELNIHLCRQRATLLNQAADVAQKALTNATTKPI